MSPDQLSEYNRYLDKLSSAASIVQTINFEAEFKLKQAELKHNQKIFEIATKMIVNGDTNEKIRDYTELLDEQIDLIRNNMNDK